MTTQSRSIANRLSNAQIVLTNVFSSDTIKDALARYGYNDYRLQHGQDLYNTALVCQQQQKVAYGQLMAAREALTTVEAQTKREYMHDVKVARVALASNRGAQQQLDLMVQRQQGRANWLLQAQQFYANALENPAILNMLEPYGLSKTRLEIGKKSLATVNKCHAAQIKHIGLAQAATRAQDEALGALGDWMHEFQQIARLAFKNQPETLEQLRITTHRPKSTRNADEVVRE